MPSGKPGKFSTRVVRESCPPGSWPSRTSGLRLARAVYRAAVCPEQPEPRMITFRMFSLMDGEIETRWLDEWQAGWFQPQPSYQDSSLAQNCERKCSAEDPAQPPPAGFIEVLFGGGSTEEKTRSSACCSRTDPDSTCGSWARPMLVRPWDRCARPVIRQCGERSPGLRSSGRHQPA